MVTVIETPAYRVLWVSLKCLGILTILLAKWVIIYFLTCFYRLTTRKLLSYRSRSRPRHLACGQTLFFDQKGDKARSIYSIVLGLIILISSFSLLLSFLTRRQALYEILKFNVIFLVI